MITKEQWAKVPARTKVYVLDMSGNKTRIRKYDETSVFVYAKGSSRYGWNRDADYACSAFSIVESSLPGVKWKKNVDKVVKELQRTGLWPNILAMYKNLQTMSYEDFKEISKIYVSLPYIPKESDNDRWERIKTAFGGFIAKYPFIFTEQNVDYNYLCGGLADAQLKSMYFGWNNTNEKACIKEAMKNKQPIRAYGRTSYDVSFEYDPDNNKAYYCEEYKDCGNGHYYLAINENTALWCEDD